MNLMVERLATQTTEWGLNMMMTGSFKLREVERKAKQGRLGMWHNYVPPAGSATKQSGKFKGTVAEVRSASRNCHGYGGFPIATFGPSESRRSSCGVQG